MKYNKILKFHNHHIHLLTNSYFIANLIQEQLEFNKFTASTKRIRLITVKLEEVKYFPHGRSDNFINEKSDLTLESWLKNVLVIVNSKKNLIEGKILTPTALSPEAIFDLVFIHPLRHILKQRNIFLIHCATLVKNNSGILICGGFGCGKSTLAIKLVEQGFNILSDEFVIYEKDMLYSLPLKAGLKIGSIKIFPKLKNLNKKILPNSEKISFNLEKFYPGAFIKKCLPRIIIFTTPQENNKKIYFQPINQETAFCLLCKDKDNSLPIEKNLKLRQKQIQALARLSKKTQSYFLSFGLDKINQAAKIIQKLTSSLA